MAHPHNAHRQHKVEHRRVHHIAGYDCGGTVEDNKPDVGPLARRVLVEKRGHAGAGLARLVVTAVGQRHRMIGRRRVDERIDVPERLTVTDEQDAHTTL